LNPDNSADEGMRTRPNAENPEVRNIYSQLITAIHRWLPWGNTFRSLHSTCGW